MRKCFQCSPSSETASEQGVREPFFVPGTVYTLLYIIICLPSRSVTASVPDWFCGTSSRVTGVQESPLSLLNVDASLPLRVRPTSCRRPSLCFSIDGCMQSMGLGFAPSAGIISGIFPSLGSTGAMSCVSMASSLGISTYFHSFVARSRISTWNFHPPFPSVQEGRDGCR